MCWRLASAKDCTSYLWKKMQISSTRLEPFILISLRGVRQSIFWVAATVHARGHNADEDGDSSHQFWHHCCLTPGWIDSRGFRKNTRSVFRFWQSCKRGLRSAASVQASAQWSFIVLTWNAQKEIISIKAKRRANFANVHEEQGRNRLSYRLRSRYVHCNFKYRYRK